MSYTDYANELNEQYNDDKKPIDLDIGFYGLLNYQPDAWDETIKSIRKFYPDAPIVLINDGNRNNYEELAKKYSCTLLKEEIEIQLHWPDIVLAYEFLDRTKKACILAKTKWIIHLHSDVICQGKIKYYPPSQLCGVSAGSKNGKSGNNWDCSSELEKVGDYIKQHQPCAELNGWGWCGGSIMNIDAFMYVYDSVLGDNPKYNLKLIRDLTWKYIFKHEDTMMSVLFELNGFSYRIWKDNPEYHRKETDKRGAFLHGYKEFYNSINKNITTSKQYAKFMLEDLEKYNSDEYKIQMRKLYTKYNNYVV